MSECSFSVVKYQPLKISMWSPFGAYLYYFCLLTVAVAQGSRKAIDQDNPLHRLWSWLYPYTPYLPTPGSLSLLKERSFLRVGLEIWKKAVLLEEVAGVVWILPELVFGKRCRRL